MFNFLKKKNTEEKPVEKNEVKSKLHMFKDTEDELFDDPSFCMLIQCDHKSGNFLVSFSAQDKSPECLEAAVILLSQLSHGGCQDTIYESILLATKDAKEYEFYEELVAKCQEMDKYVNEAKYNMLLEEFQKKSESSKNKIDPSKIFNMKGMKYEQ